MENRRRLIQDVSPKPISKPPASARYTSPASRPGKPAVTPRSGTGPKKRSKRVGKLMFGALVLAILAVGAGLLIKPDQEPKETVAANPPKVQAESVEEVIPPIDLVTIESKITAILQRHPNLEISLAYKDIKTSASLKMGVDETFNVASVSKLLTATLFLQEVQNGKYTLETPVAGVPANEQLRRLIEVSDNPAWDAFNRLLTSAALDQFAVQTGLSNYRTASNTSTPTDIVILLEKLYDRKLLNDEYTKLLLSHMEKASERQYIPKALPEGVKVYHKAGYLSDRAHDAAIIDNGKRPFVLVIFTKSDGNYDFIVGQQLMHEITGAIWPAYLLS